jgi:polyisoprenoid-binding protein YceI
MPESVSSKASRLVIVSPTLNTNCGQLSGKIKRTDFGLTWNKALETGGVVVGETVTLDVQVEVTR